MGKDNSCKTGRLKVFISWSGETSRGIAKVLCDWLPHVIPAVDPWMSDDIGKGEIWFWNLLRNLNETDIGLVCLTRDSLKSPWIYFEAGALSMFSKKPILCLWGVEPEDLQQTPLAHFQAAMLQEEGPEEGMRRVVRAINCALDDGALSDKQLDEAFDKEWPHLRQCLKLPSYTPNLF